MSDLLLPLASPQATLARAGGKGANLAELARAGFPVPPGFLITTDAYRAFVAANRIADRLLDLAKQVAPDDPLALEETSSEIRALFTRGELPAPIAEQIGAAYRALSETGLAEVARQGEGETRGQGDKVTRRQGDKETGVSRSPGLPVSHSPTLPLSLARPVAVRSSATAEDLPGLSFAGQQDTYLNVVGTDALLEAVKQCWGSLWTARAIGYRARNNIPPDDVALAVVVQVMVPSEVSGVLFTANPLTGRRDEIVIDASFGLGEALVSGQVEPDHYIVDPHTWRIAERKLGAKALAIVPRAGGGTERTDFDGATRQALSDERIVQLARVGWRVAEHFGSPQDVEWAWAGERLALVQSRPITSLYPLPVSMEQPGKSSAGTVSGLERDLRVYFSFNSVQGVPDPITPLGRDVLRILMYGLIEMVGAPRSARSALSVAGGRLFVDVTGMLRDPSLRRIYLTMMSNADPGARQTILRLIDKRQIVPKQVRGRRLPVSPRWLRRLRILSLPALRRVLAALQAPEYTRARARVEADAFLAIVEREASAAKTLPALLDVLERDLGRMIERVFLKILPVAIPGLASMALADRLLVAWLGMKPGQILRLMRGLSGNVTTEMDLRLWALAQTIRADADAYAFMRAQSVEALVDAYRRGALPSVAQRVIEQFMDRYGMRAVAEIDVGRPRWRDDPAGVMQIIRGYLQLDDPDLAPDRMFQRGAAESERLGAEYVALVRRTRGGAVRARLIGALIRRARLLTGMREAPKFYMIRAFDVYRTALLRHARDLVARGALERAEDIFFVSMAQLRRAARGEALDLKAIVAAERAEYERERARRQMPRVLLSTGEAFYDGLSEEDTSDLVGDAVSPGVVEGRVRVVRDPRGVRLEPGEILVCPATDPGWTPLFLTAGGLVMELGGMITHGSVVAREYGIPAVVGVHDATMRLRTGQRVRVDGSHGRVTLLEEAGAG